MPGNCNCHQVLVEEGSYRYILSGSLLGVEIKNLRSAPVGYMDVKDMYPLDLKSLQLPLVSTTEL